MIKDAKEAAVYTDFQGLKKMGAQAKNNQDGMLDSVAHQFESIFIQLALKSMRDANQPLASDLFNSNQMALYQDMYDKQISLHLSGQQLGLSEVLKQQLSKNSKNQGDESDNSSTQDIRKSATPLSLQLMKGTSLPGITDGTDLPLITPPQNATSVTNDKKQFESKQDFIKTLWAEAKSASKALGVHPAVLIAQAALETDWGRKVIKHKGGETSHNLFNIKAGNSWDKDTVKVKTLEYKKGVVGYEQAAFRSYDSFSDSFNDYIHLLKNNDRYDNAIKSASNPQKFLEELQQGGYATDPKYAKKILKILDGDAFQSFLSGK